MKICFNARANFITQHTKIAKEMYKKGIEVVIVTQNAAEAAHIKSIFDEVKVYELDKYIKETFDKISFEEIERVKNKYNNYNLWRLLYTDRFLVDYGTQDAIKFVIAHIKFYEELMETEEPDYYINEAIAIYSSYASYIVAQLYNCKYLSLMIARDAAQEKFFFFDNPEQINYKMIENYEKNEFSREEYAEAQKYLEVFREKKPMPEYMKRHKKPPRFRVKFLGYPLKFLMLWRKEEYRTKTCYMTYNRMFEHTYAPFVMWSNYLRSKKYYMQPDFTEKYYLYTLHFQPEASTLVCAEKYEKQLFAIDNIAKSIPFGTVLYVKEHYSCLGHRELDFYRRLKKYPNVRLIDPYYDIHTLIKKSEAVIVLTNTTGFEAILHNKKVFILGDVFYQYAPNAVKIEDVYKEYKKLEDVNVTTSDEDIIRFLCAYFRELRRGTVLYPSLQYEEDENIRKLVEAILREIDYEH